MASVAYREGLGCSAMESFRHGRFARRGFQRFARSRRLRNPLIVVPCKNVCHLVRIKIDPCQ